MKKYLFGLLAAITLGLTACEDVPEPYMINTTPSEIGGGETGNDSILLSETFASSLGDFTSVSTVGEYDWIVSYSCAQITSYNSSDKTNNPADSWLISKALNFSNVESAHINFEYILRYANSSEVNTNYLCLISKDYNGDPAAATWTTLDFKPQVGTDWNTWYESGDIAVPADYCGASSVVIALRYIATTKSATWEVRNFVCARGEAQASQTTTAEATGDGTRTNPYNAVAANQVIASGDIPADAVYVKGIVSSINKIDTSYGNATFYISDDGSTSNQFYIYRAYALGNKKFTSEDELNVGDEVVVYGKLVNYNGTYEMTQGGYIVEQNGVSSDSGSTETKTDADAAGTGTSDDPYNVAGAVQQYNTNGDTEGQYVVGYIVGYVEGKTLSSGATFNADNVETKTNLLLADDASCTDYTKCLTVQLTTGNNIRADLNLGDNPGNLGKKVKLLGTITKYFGAPGLKSPTAYEFQ